MAKVKTASINTSVLNDAPFPGLVSLEVTEELSPSDDIDIDSFFNDDETYLKDKYFDKNKRCVEKIDNGLSHILYENTDTLPNAIQVKKSVSSNFVSHGSIKENNLEKENMLSELCFDNNFSLSNVILNNTRKNKDTKSIISNDSLASLDLCLEPEDDFQTTEKDSFDLFMSSLNEKSDGDLTTSLNDILSPKKHEFSKDSVKIDFNFASEPSSRSTSESYSSDASDELLPDILVFSSSAQQKLVDNSSSELADLLDNNSPSVSFSSDSSELLSSGTSGFSSYSSGDGQSKLGEGTLDLDFIPDINLNCCIREDAKGKLQSTTKNFETKDSGYETDLPLGQLSVTLEKKQTNSAFRSSNSPVLEKSPTRPRHSLFSKALSAKLIIDDKRKKKLQIVRSKLLTNFPDCYLECDKSKNSSVVEKAIDHTNECVVMSSFLMVPSEN